MGINVAKRNSADGKTPPLVVGVGASAGGLEPFQELVAEIGDAAGMAIVFVPQLNLPSKSQLTNSTSMEIVELSGRRKLKPSKIYLCPPQRLLEIKNGFVKVIDNADDTGPTNPIDHFLHSIAEDQGERGVGVILSGGGSDGTLGLKAISDAGGLTFAQDPQSAKFDSMPRSAATTGVADHVLTPIEIARELLQYSQHLAGLVRPDSQVQLHDQIVEAIPAIAERLTTVTTHNFQHYKTNTLSRRIQRRMQVLKISEVNAYICHLNGSEDETHALFRELLIGVTAFFRDPDAFKALARKVLPKVFENRASDDVIRIWVAGCATGAEAYTLAILCCEQQNAASPQDLRQVKIFATDIDERSLQIARAGKYPVGIEDQVSPERLKRFFIKRGKRYQVTKELRDMVVFSPHNLISDPPFSRLDLISCRNLLIYLGSHLQKKLIPVFHYALRPAGFLFLGPSENISSHAELFRPLDAKFRISQRKGTAIGSVTSIAVRPTEVEVKKNVGSSQIVDTSADLTEIRQRILLDEFSPKSCIIDESGQVLNASANMQKFLSLGDGDFHNNIVKMAARGLKLGLRSSIAEARKSQRRVQHDKLSIRVGSQIQRVMLTVQPMPRLGEDESLFMVVFQEVGLPINRDEVQEASSQISTDGDAIVAQLERELETTREDLDKSVQDMEAANEELKSSNEELLSMNEELQSANEELETSKEEISAGSEAVAQAHSDLENLLRSSQIATVFLDEDLLIRHFTPAISEIYELINTDIGRPLERFVPLVKNMPPLPDPKQIRDNNPVEHTITTDSGKSFIRRVRPNESHTGEYDGIVVTFLDVTELQLSKNKLARREAQLKTITDAIPPMIAFVDREDRFRFVNASYAKQWQKPVEELIGQKISDVVGADVFREIEPHLRESQAGEQVTYDLTLPVPGSGEVLYHEMIYVPDTNSDGSVSGVYIVVNDMTERRQFTQQIVEREAQLASIMSSTAEGIYGIDPEGNCTFANAACAALLGYESPDDLLGRQMHELSHHTRSNGTPYPKEECHIYEALRDGRKVHVNDEVFWRADGTSFDVEYWSHPQIQNGQMIGCVVTFFDITERRRTDTELSSAKARLELSLEVADVAPWSWNMQTGEPVSNPTLNRLFGFDENAAPALSEFVDRMDETERNRIASAINRSLMTAETYDEEYPIRWPDGEVRYVRARGRVETSDDGTAEDFFGVIVDITERKRRELELADREAQLRRVIDSTLFFIGVLDVDGTLLEANATAIIAGDVSRDQVIGKKFWDCYWWNYDAAVSEKLRRDIETARSGEIVRSDVVVRMANDTRMTVDFMLSPVRDQDGRITHLIPSGVDVSDRVHAEAAVIQREQRLQLALDSGRMGLWEWDIAADVITWSDQLYTMFGYTQQEFDPSKEGFLDVVHPDDRPMLQRMIQSAFSRTCETHEVEFRVIRGTDRSIVWTHSRGTIHRDADGIPASIVSVAIDITERKQWETGLVDREAHLRRVINNQLGLVGVIDRDGILVEVDDRSLAIAQVAREDVIGKQFAEAPWWSYDAAVTQRMHDAMQQAFNGEVVRYDVSLFAHGDAGLMIDFMIAPIFDDKGEVEYLIPSGVDISDRIKAETKIRDNEQRLKMALHAGGMAAWEWTPQASIWTDELYHLFGLSGHEVACPETLFRIVHPADLDLLQQAWTKVTAGEALYDHEFRIIRPDGKTRWIFGVGDVVRDASGNVVRVFGLNWDTTEQKELQEQIRLSERRFREMANAAPAMVWVTDENHECTFLSQSWCEFTGQSEEDGHGRGWLAPVHADDRDATEVTFLAAAKNQEAFELDCRLLTVDGRYRWVIDASKPRFNQAGEFLGYVGSITDAHDRHEAQLALNEARKAAEAANESKSAFLANMSHEIRTPMTAVLGYAEVVSDLIDHPEAAAHLQTIRRNGAFLLEIINDILDLSKIESGKLDIVREYFDPARLVEDVRSIMDVRAVEGGIALDVEYSGKIPAKIDSDPKRLKQILINLVGNAIKFTKHGGVKVIVTHRRRLPSKTAAPDLPTAHGDSLQFDIIDSGIGMTEQQQARLFQPFSQGDHKVNREFGGTGLGLVISQRLANMLGGRITVKSKQGHGSTFSVSVAVGNIQHVKMVHPTIAAEAVDDVPPARVVRLSCHALVVDDRRDIRFLSRKFLSDAGATVSEAEDGELALSAVKEAMSTGDPIDIIILDMQMPKLDGYETAKALRLMKYPGPIIALTADAMQGDMSRCLECGCNDYLSKPIDKNALLEKVERYLQGAS